MQIKFLNLWNRYVQYYFNHFSSSGIKKREEGLPYLRDNLFVSVLLISFPICCIVYIPSLLVSISTREYIISVADSIALFCFFLIFVNNRISITVKKISFAFIFYLLAIMIVFFLGIEGPGMIILICTSVLLTLFQSKKAGLYSATLNVVIYTVMLIILDTNSANLILFKQYSYKAWIGIGVNLFAFNVLIVLSVSSLIKQLNESFLKEKKLQELLTIEGINLLAAKHKAEESERLKSAFLANMSHEIRTPMNGILGFTSLLGEPDLEVKERQEYLNMIQKSGVRMLDTINDIIEFSRIESGFIDLDFRDTYINEQIEYVYNFFKRDADIKCIGFSIKNPLSFEESLIKTDSKKLFIILSNLVKNAIKFTDFGTVELGYIIKPDVIEFFVKDTGIGIPLDRQKAIFERFIQADIEDKKAHQGSGLGLSIAKSYVDALGGKIWLESTPGKGSSFYFTIPRSTLQVKTLSNIFVEN